MKNTCFNCCSFCWGWVWSFFYRSYWILVSFLYRVVALWLLERSFVFRCMSGHLFLDRQCTVVYHHVRMWCVVLADRYSAEPEGAMLAHKGYVFKQAEEVVCVSVVVLVRVATLVGSQLGHQLVLL